VRPGGRREGQLRAYLDLPPDGRRGDAYIYARLGTDP
jgi:hypothetical protein